MPSHRRAASTMLVAAVVVTFNRPDVLRACLAALRGQTRPLNRIIVVDNGAVTETSEMIAAEFPSVRVVGMGHNTGAAGGFAAGMSEGVASGHDWIWMFNDDDVPHQDALATMLGSLESLPDQTGILGCARHDGDGTPYGLGLHWRHRQIVVDPVPPETPPIALDAVAFSGTLVSSDVIRHVGVPRPEYFMMVEELEYCVRARDAGWLVYVLPQGLVKALALGSGGLASPWRGYYQSRNSLDMSLRRRSPVEVWWWAVRTAKLSYGAVRSGDAPLERIKLRLLGAWHAIRGVSGRTIEPSP